MNRNTFSAVCIISIFMATFLSCCNSNKNYNQKDAALHYLDSVLNRTRNMDTLNAWAERYETQGKKVEAERVFRKLGSVSRESDDYIQALKYHNKALTIATELNSRTEMIMCLNQIGTDYRRIGSYDEATTYHYRALKLCDEYEDATTDFAIKNRVTSLNGIGNINLALGNMDEAVKSFREALDGETKLGSHLGMAINYANIGSVFEHRHIYDSARVYYELSMEHNKIAKSRLGISLCHNHFGNLAEKAGNFDEAIREYRAAYDVMESSSDRWHWLNACVSLIKVYIAQGNMSEAKIYLDKAEKTANDIKSKDYFALVYHMKYLYNEKQGNVHQALDNYILSSIYNDSIMNLENVNHVRDLTARYEAEKSEIKIASLEQEKKALQTITVIGIALFISVSGGLLALFLFIRQKNRLAKQQIIQMEKEKQLIATHAVLEGETAERSRIAQDLHDGLGGMLTGIKMNMNELKKGATLEYSSVEQFNKALSLLDDSMRELRRVAHHLMPESLSRYGLKIALTDFCNSIPNAEFSYFGKEKRLDSKTEVMIYHVMHELVNNAMKHSGATRILTQIVQDEDSISFTVEDNGCGFDINGVKRGMGIKNIQSRIASFGGTMVISSKPNQGTEITVELTINNDNIKKK